MYDEGDATVPLPTFGLGAFFADRYRIDAVLGTGAMGRVYAATELHSERRVALKVLHRERLGEAETVARFQREAEVLASIGHPCIVEVYTFHHTSDGTPFLAMELLEGVTLKTRLRNVGRFEDPRDFQDIVDCVCGALAAAHERGIVHRDLKPDNVFLPATGEPRAKLVDFGLSRIAVADKSLTASGAILGTPRYMAPEQIRDARAAGPLVDIYALGVLMFESLTGRSPYPAQDYGQLLGCVLENRVTPFEQLRPDLPRAVGDVIRGAMAADPAARLPSCDAVADAYGAAIGTPSRRKLLAARPRSSEPRAPRRIPSNQDPMIPSKSSTLAFDASALERLRAPAETAPALAAGQGPAPTHVPPEHAPSPPLPDARPWAHPAARGGDTIFLPGAAAPGAAPASLVPSGPSWTGTSYAPPAAASHGVEAHAPAVQSFAPGASPAPPTKRRLVVLLFLVAMIVVIALSAALGLGLRAYYRRGLRLPPFVTGE